MTSSSCLASFGLITINSNFQYIKHYSPQICRLPDPSLCLVSTYFKEEKCRDHNYTRYCGRKLTESSLEEALD